MMKKTLGICSITLITILSIFSISLAQGNEKKVPIYFSADEVEENFGGGFGGDAFCLHFAFVCHYRKCSYSNFS